MFQKPTQNESGICLPVGRLQCRNLIFLFAPRHDTQSIGEQPLPSSRRLTRRAGVPFVGVASSTTWADVVGSNHISRVRREKRKQPIQALEANEIASELAGVAKSFARGKPACCSHAGRSHEEPGIVACYNKATLRQLSRSVHLQLTFTSDYLQAVSGKTQLALRSARLKAVR